MPTSRVRASPFVALAAIALLVPATLCPAEPGDTAGLSPLTLCLAAAADDSAVYPLTEVPANHRAFTVVFRLRDTESFRTLTHAWTAVDVGDVAPGNTEIDRADLDLKGMKHGVLRFRLPRDFPVGKYRVDVLADGKPWAKLEFRVVAPQPVTPLPKPGDLLPLAVGTKWTYSFLLEAGPIVKNLTLAGGERGADGKWRATMTYTVAAAEEAGARVEVRRSDVLVNEEWWRLDVGGLGISRDRTGGQESSYDPPVPTMRLPLESSTTWLHKAKDGSFERAYKMWGPLPVVGPKGLTPGFILLSSQVIPRGLRTTETHFAPGVGAVRVVAVDFVSGMLRTRIETRIAPAK